MERLARLARGRLLLVSGDKGNVDEAALHGAAEPAFTAHGSFSFSVNYHAVGEWFRRRGGEVLRTRHSQGSLHVSAFLLGVPDAEETRFAYHLGFEGPGPDDVYRLREVLQEHAHRLGFEPLLAQLRLSRYDPRTLRDCLPVLMLHAGRLSRDERKELASVVQRTWENYYFLGESQDLPFDFAVLLHDLGEYEAALGLFRESLRLFGEAPATGWNAAMCQFALGRPEEAARQLARVWELAPDFKPERLLLAKKD